VLVFDASNPARPKAIGSVRVDAPGEARGLFLDGPWLYAAAGTAGLLVVDVSDPAAPALLARTPLHDGTGADDARAVSVLFQFSRPSPLGHRMDRVPARSLAVVANGELGLALVDVTHPEKPSLVGAMPLSGGVLDVALATVYELGSEGGGIPSRERDLAIALSPASVHLIDVSDPGGPSQAGPAIGIPGGGARSLAVVRAYNPPFLQTHVAIAAAAGLVLAEITRPREAVLRGTVAAVGLAGVAVEEFPLDRLVDPRGKPLKDISHEGARYLDAAEIRRVLTAPVR